MPSPDAAVRARVAFDACLRATHDRIAHARGCIGCVHCASFERDAAAAQADYLGAVERMVGKSLPEPA